MKIYKIARFLIYCSLLSCSGGGELNNSDRTIDNPSTGETSVPTDSPILISTTPISPAINGTPTINGQAEANSTINIYTDSSCNNLVASGTASSAQQFSITVNLDGGTRAAYYAKAKAPGKDISPCSISTISYSNNSIRPGLGWFSGTETTAPASATQVNQTTPYALEWSSSEFDSTYFTHDTGLLSEKITIKQDGDYWVSATLPLTMLAGTFRPVTRLEVRVNGALVPGAVGESSYIRYDVTGNSQSSSHLSMLLVGLSVNDVIEVFVNETAGDVGDEVVQISTVASMLVEYVNSSREIFAASATRTVASTNINQAAASAFEWSESRKGSSYTHDDGANPENIIFSQPGNYLVTINAPISTVLQRGAPKLLVKLNGAVVDGGQASQGYMRGDSGHNESSLHWSGIIAGVSAADILTITSEQEALAGTVTIQAGGSANINIEKLSTDEKVISLKATTLSSGSNWNSPIKSAIVWDTSVVTNTDFFTHSTIANQHQITVTEQGDYMLVYNDTLTAAIDRPNPIIKVQVNSVDVTGAETKTHYMRNVDGHNESTASLVFLLRNLTAGDKITLTSQQEDFAGTVNDLREALLSIVKK